MLDWTDAGCGGGWTAPDHTADAGADAPDDTTDVGAGAAATWVGDTINIVRLGPPDTSVVADLGTYTVTDQVQKIPVDVLGLVTFLLSFGPQGFTVQITGGDQTEAAGGSVEFFGFKFTDQSIPEPYESGKRIVSAENNGHSTFGLTPGALEVGSNFVQLNLIDITRSVGPGDFLSVDVVLEA